MKKILTWVLLTFFVATIQLSVHSVKASAIADKGSAISTKDSTSDITELKLNSVLTNWVLDESTNTLCAISEEGKALFLINAKTLKIEKGLILNSNPTDIIVDNGKLYISLDKFHQILVFDIASKKIIKTLKTTSDPYRIVKDGNKLYYTEFDQWCNIYEYDLVKNTDSQLSIGTYYNPDIAINTDKHLLYIGESGSSGSNMIYYSTTNNNITSRTNYNDGYGFSYPGRKVLFDGKNVYYAGRNFDMENPNQIIGKYSNSSIIFAKNGYVFTNQDIYDRESYSSVGNFDAEVSLVELSKQSDLYYYNNANRLITKSSQDVTAPVVSGVVNGTLYNHTVTIDFNEGTATLDGKAFTKGKKVTSQGQHVLKVVDSNGNSTTVKFTIDSIAPIGIVKINNGAESTESSTVKLNFFVGEDVPSSGIGYVMISNTQDFKGATWTPYVFTKTWTLSSGNGGKQVYVKLKDKAGNISAIFTDTIMLKAKV